MPHAVALRIFSYVPADERARAALVCRAWHVTVSDPQLWTVLDLSPASGVAQPVSDATLRGAAALAHGGLTALRLDGCVELTARARLEVVTANACSLCKLSCLIEAEHASLSGDHVVELLVASPQLVAFEVDLTASVAEATRMLRHDAPFGALQMRSLLANGPDTDDGEAPLGEAELLAFCSAVSAHASLVELHVQSIPLDSPVVIDSFFAAALACKLLYLHLFQCNLSPASVPALAQLIRGGRLEFLNVFNNGFPLLGEAAAVQLADAVAVSRTLTRLQLQRVCLWDDAAATAIFMRALTGHPRLQELDISFNDPPDPFAAGAALGALVATNTPALQTLGVSFSRLGDAGLGGICYALPRNTHLRELKLSVTGLNVEFARHTLLPSVRANTSLRKLDATEYWGGDEPPELLEVQALLAARRHAADANS